MERIALVTGGAGFIGKYFCKRLVDVGYYVICVDNLMSESALPPSEWPVPLKCNVEFHKMDCRDYFKNAALGLVRDYDLIIHLAAVVGGRAKLESAPLEVSEDLSIDAAFFNWLTRLPSRKAKVVYFSSSAVYPVHLQQLHIPSRLLSEDLLSFSNPSIGVPDVTCGWAKMTGEYLAKVAHDVYGINIVCYRPFSGYAETQNGAYPFNGILKRVMKNESPIDIWSDSVRDFVHIDDVLDCVFHTMYLVQDGSAINIGTGRPTSFSQLANMMLKEAGHKGEPEMYSKQWDYMLSFF